METNYAPNDGGEAPDRIETTMHDDSAVPSLSTAPPVRDNSSSQYLLNLVKVAAAINEMHNSEEVIRLTCSSALIMSGAISVRKIMFHNDGNNRKIDINRVFYLKENDLNITEIGKDLPVDDLWVRWLNTDTMSNIIKDIHPAMFKGFFSASFGLVPADVCERIEKELGIGYFATVPLRWSGVARGIFVYASNVPLDADLLELYATQVSLALKNNQMLEEIRRHHDELEELVLARTEELELKNKLLEETQTVMFQQEKLAGIGQLAAGLAHEINNPISYVYSNLNVLGEYSEEIKECYLKFHDLFETARQSADEGVKQKAEEFGLKINDNVMEDMVADIGELVKESREGAQRVKDIVQNLRHFSRPGEKYPVDSDINLGLERTLMVIWNELKYKAEVHKDFKTLPYIRCYPQELNQVFMNIILNAAQAIGEKGDIWVSTDVKDDAIRIIIEDNGKGIAPEHINNIFEPFFTTNEVGSGTGLGLATAYNIVKQHSGRILVESAYGKGSKFTIMLPIEGILESVDVKTETNK